MISSCIHSPTLSESSYVQQYAIANTVDESTARQTVRTSSKRVAEDAAQGQPSAKKQRNERTCIRCGRNSACPGRASWYLCNNPCRDCKVLHPRVCVGRSSKYPQKARCKPGQPYSVERLSDKEMTNAVCKRFNVTRHGQGTGQNSLPFVQ
ncbi:hypothetical protein GGX14DRAFT_368307 [Mycena pura]|uniref:Uncharacterized protein n=1 Tax=Mycena pura TaxID=153505 RepID=A0AAD6V7F0_9AGAR|nr:hypothetical protein GGX14DRAFT_368307 [Mycena pura]